MKPTEKLSKEHENILKLIRKLKKEVEKLEQGGKINKEFFYNSIDFIRNYADKFHHAKEEEILFRELEKEENKQKLHCNPVAQMLEEHEDGRNFVKNLEKGVEKNDKEKVIENTKGYCELLEEHISKEDNVLYPMADEVLDNKTQKKLMEEFEKTSEKFDNKERLKIIS